MLGGGLRSPSAFLVSAYTVTQIFHFLYGTWGTPLLFLVMMVLKKTFCGTDGVPRRFPQLHYCLK